MEKVEFHLSTSFYVGENDEIGEKHPVSYVLLGGSRGNEMSLENWLADWTAGRLARRTTMKTTEPTPFPERGLVYVSIDTFT